MTDIIGPDGLTDAERADRVAAAQRGPNWPGTDQAGFPSANTANYRAPGSVAPGTQSTDPNAPNYRAPQAPGVGGFAETDAQRQARVAAPAPASTGFPGETDAQRQARIDLDNKVFPGRGVQPAGPTEAERVAAMQRGVPADPAAQAEAARLASLTPGERKAQMDGNPHGEPQGLAPGNPPIR